MLPLKDLAAFALVCLAMVCTPGPNMIYLISRSASQGRRAGLISLIGIALGFVIYMLSAVLGLTALMMAVPFLYEALRFAGVAYLLYLAWQTVRPGGRSAFAVVRLSPDGPRRLFAMGLATSLLNPKIAVLYLSLLPQFIRPELGSPLAHGLILGSTQIVVSVSINLLIVMSAGSIAASLATRPGWQLGQRWITGTLLGALAVRMATETRR
ncbi:MAG: LysE family translocator [Allosphingosinicella sp.]